MSIDLKALKAKLVEHFKNLSADLKKNKVCQLSEKLIKEGESSFSLTVPKANGAGTAAVSGSRFASIEAALAYVDKIDLSPEEKKAVIDATRHGWELSKELIKQCKAHLKGAVDSKSVDAEAANAASTAYAEAQKAYVVADAPAKKTAVKRKAEDAAGDTVAKEVKSDDAVEKPKKAPRKSKDAGESSPSAVKSPKKPRKPKAPAADISAAEIEQVISGVVPNALQH